MSGFDWEALLNRTMPAPLSINVRGEDDVSMFDEYDDDDGPDVGVSRCKAIYVSEAHSPCHFVKNRNPDMMF